MLFLANPRFFRKKAGKGGSGLCIQERITHIEAGKNMLGVCLDG